MAQNGAEIRTPWQKVHSKFAMSPSRFAREIGRHRSKISRALRDEKGLINGRDQEIILATAARLNVNVTPSDLTPDHP